MTKPKRGKRGPYNTPKKKDVVIVAIHGTPEEKKAYNKQSFKKRKELIQQLKKLILETCR